MVIKLFLKMILICTPFHNPHAKSHGILEKIPLKRPKKKMFEPWHNHTYDTVMSISSLKLPNVIEFPLTIYLYISHSFFSGKASEFNPVLYFKGCYI